MKPMFKPFFVHFNRPVTKTDNSSLRHAPRGFTAYITPLEEPRKVGVQVAWCSSKDEFTKSSGRKYAEVADIVHFNPREVPELLSMCANTCLTNAYENVGESQYMYVLKYVV
jgi:hypothetical protein